MIRSVLPVPSFVHLVILENLETGLSAKITLKMNKIFK